MLFNPVMLLRNSKYYADENIHYDQVFPALMVPQDRASPCAHAQKYAVPQASSLLKLHVESATAFLVAAILV